MKNTPLNNKSAAGSGKIVVIGGSGLIGAKVVSNLRQRGHEVLAASPIPYTIVRATQFFEFVGGIAQAATQGETVRLPSALMQPIVSDDVAAAMADAALAAPRNGMVEVAGPEPIRQDELVRQFLE